MEMVKEVKEYMIEKVIYLLYAIRCDYVFVKRMIVEQLGQKYSPIKAVVCRNVKKIKICVHRQQNQYKFTIFLFITF